METLQDLALLGVFVAGQIIGCGLLVAGKWLNTFKKAVNEELN